MEKGRKENDEKRLSVHHTILELENLTSKNESLFGEYRSWIHGVMKKPANLQKKGLKELISSLILRETQIKVALSGVNLKEPVRVVFASSRWDEPEANIGAPLILDSIQLPPKMLLRSRYYVTNLYIKRDLPIREIARQLNVSHQTVIECLRRLGIRDKGSRKRVITQGQIPFGFDYKNGKLEKNKKEQEVIRIIKQLRASGLSLRGIARELNKRLVPTKNNGIWQAATVSNILSRISARSN